MQTVGVIGGCGFIGSQVTSRFLAAGARVRVSATDVTKPEKYSHLRALPGADRLEVVPLNVTDRAALQAFLQGCDVAVHAGTPFQLAVDDPQRDMLDPTVKGTELFLDARDLGVACRPGREPLARFATAMP